MSAVFRETMTGCIHCRLFLSRLANKLAPRIDPCPTVGKICSSRALELTAGRGYRNAHPRRRAVEIRAADKMITLPSVYYLTTPSHAMVPSPYVRS